MTLLQILVYASLIVFLTGTIVKALKLARMPMHLRWELYPVPREKSRRLYGGSYFEEPDWWTRPRQYTFAGEIAEIIKEVIFLRTLYRNNRTLWYFSYPLHIGLYFSVGFICILFVRSLAPIAAFNPEGISTALLERPINIIMVSIAVIGFGLGAIGAGGLLLIRLLKSEYRLYSLFSDYLNLVFLIALFASGLCAWYLADKSFAHLQEFTRSLMRLTAPSDTPYLVRAELALAAIFLLYLPFTHMTHFMGKFFTYHRVKWQTQPSSPGNEIEKNALDALGRPLSWSASHMETGKTWSAAASGTGEDSGKDPE
jgi:nitrate reductase gamma subunit